MARPYDIMAWPPSLAWPYNLIARPFGLMALRPHSLAAWPALMTSWPDGLKLFSDKFFKATLAPKVFSVQH